MMGYNNLICLLFNLICLRERVVLVRWKNPCVRSTGTLTTFLATVVRLITTGALGGAHSLLPPGARRHHDDSSYIAATTSQPGASSAFLTGGGGRATITPGQAKVSRAILSDVHWTGGITSILTFTGQGVSRVY